ncbi:RmlC-like cupin domain-containing protein [Lineolata rhizophorae]|uniref:RmlC-like cupin domain-containing protein n=1 Tax=Lineolata rhizophorae TaxID=578093 RepID=A0A6A6NM92_9PEZI|nr:RmlC-like cupin domain-containing protein [Lineolata rhizophorae]
MSTIPGLSAPLHPSFTAPSPPSSTPPEPSPTASTISALNMQVHIEGGYFVETDRDPLRVPNPFQRSPPQAPAPTQPTAEGGDDDDDATRSASTSIFYLLTPARPQGAFHRNKGRTVHTLHWGRGRYVLLHADESGEGGEGKEKVRVETFVVGKDLSKGERLQWVVEGGKYKASFLLEDEEGVEGSEGGLLISETVVPGFEYKDHDFLRKERLEEFVTPEQAEEMAWLVRRD